MIVVVLFVVLVLGCLAKDGTAPGARVWVVWIATAAANVCFGQYPFLVLVGCKAYPEVTIRLVTIVSRGHETKERNKHARANQASFGVQLI